MIQFGCTCGKQLQAREEHVGLQVVGPSCGSMLAVPGNPQAVRPAAVPSAPPMPAPVPSGYTAGRPYPGPGPGAPRARREHGAAPALSGKALASLILGTLTIVLPVL